MNQRIPRPESCKSKEAREKFPQVTGAMDSRRLLQVSHDKQLLIERLKYETSLGHRRKKTMPWRSAGLGFVSGAPRNRCSASTQSPMKTATLWKMKTTRAGGYVNVGVRFLRRVLKARGTIAVNLSCDTFRRLLTTDAEKLTDMNLMNSWPQKESAPGPDGVL